MRRFDLRLVIQNHIQQGIMDLHVSVVIYIPQSAEFVHEEADPRSRCANHFRQGFLTDFPYNRLRASFLPEICKQKNKPREALFAQLNNWSSKSGCSEPICTTGKALKISIHCGW